ncbi:hypothetical protein MNBD_GAMMA26-1757 [hydrothermal vent metagenome]|uniref:Uncharacterized protein n=1 Tax=hydrothermal vent metagenome TaxID=652676 RepID=A0A3B1B208_9ZZZZ
MASNLALDVPVFKYTFEVAVTQEMILSRICVCFPVSIFLSFFPTYFRLSWWFCVTWFFLRF